MLEDFFRLSNTVICLSRSVIDSSTGISASTISNEIAIMSSCTGIWPTAIPLGLVLTILIQILLNLNLSISISLQTKEQ